jgi:hypothetical protein
LLTCKAAWNTCGAQYFSYMRCHADWLGNFDTSPRALRLTYHFSESLKAIIGIEV